MAKATSPWQVPNSRSIVVDCSATTADYSFGVEFEFRFGVGFWIWLGTVSCSEWEQTRKQHTREGIRSADMTYVLVLTRATHSPVIDEEADQVLLTTRAAYSPVRRRGSRISTAYYSCCLLTCA